MILNIGESFVGDGVNAAHAEQHARRRSRRASRAAWATAIATPSIGHAAFMAVVQPGVPCDPPTLFVNKAAIVPGRHAELTWGAAQAGVACGVVDAGEVGAFNTDRRSGLCVIAAVWVNPEADDDEVVFNNNREATKAAILAGNNPQNWRLSPDTRRLGRSMRTFGRVNVVPPMSVLAAVNPARTPTVLRNTNDRSGARRG